MIYYPGICSELLNKTTENLVISGVPAETRRRHLLNRPAYVHTYVRAYIHAYIHTYIHTYMHTYIHTYMHAYIHKETTLSYKGSLGVS